MHRVTNISGLPIPLQLATGDVGKGMRHYTLKVKESVELEEHELSDMVVKLSKKTRYRKPAILLEDLTLLVEEATETEVPAPLEEVAAPIEEELPLEEEAEDEPVEEEESDSTFSCEACDREFDSKRGLSSHMRVHEDEN